MRPLKQFTEIVRETITGGDETAPVLIQPEAVLLVRRRASVPHQGDVIGSVIYLQQGIVVKVAEDLTMVRGMLAPPLPMFQP